MSYTNRNFTWDFDALKRFHEKYVAKPIQALRSGGSDTYTFEGQAGYVLCPVDWLQEGRVITEMTGVAAVNGIILQVASTGSPGAGDEGIDWVRVTPADLPYTLVRTYGALSFTPAEAADRSVTVHTVGMQEQMDGLSFTHTFEGQAGYVLCPVGWLQEGRVITEMTGVAAANGIILQVASTGSPGTGTEGIDWVRVTPADLPYTLGRTYGALSFTPAEAADRSVTVRTMGITERIKALEKGTASVTVSDGFSAHGDIAAGGKMELPSQSVFSDSVITFIGTVGTKAASDNYVMVGHGEQGTYSASWVKIDDTYANVYTQLGNGNVSAVALGAHGLSIGVGTRLAVCIVIKGTSVTLNVVADGATFTADISASFQGRQGKPFASSNGSLSDCRLSWSATALGGGIWLFGDSYFNRSDASRWTSYLVKAGAKVLLNGFPGARSNDGYADLTNLLEAGTPKEIVWCLGMNDHDDDDGTTVNANWSAKYNLLKNICQQKGIALVLATIPAVVNNGSPLLNKGKNAVVKSSGLRYIDFHAAVTKDADTGEWYSGMLESVEGGSENGVHPVAAGACVLYMQALADCPELAASCV